MNWLILGTRLLLGLLFFVFGSTGFLYFAAGVTIFPMPPPSPEMAPIFTGFMAMKYFMPLVKAIETVGGALLLCNRYVNLGLVLLAPLVVNILGIHLFVETSGLPISLAITSFLLIQFWARWADFRPLLKR